VIEWYYAIMLSGIIDLRSDTLTTPTPEMREAMASADVGDDVFGEDPTVNRLQELAAEKLGHEAALFVSTGTMGNLSALLAHCQRGDEVICGEWSHVFINEQGGMAALGGIQPHTVPNQPNGELRIEDIENAIREENAHAPISRVVSLENTHNRMVGGALSAEYTKQVADLAHGRGLKLHIDGARIFNAAIAHHVDVKALTQHADSVTFCLSKGLSAPVGSVVVGSKDFIHKAHRARKVLGGAMRQAGVIAAAGIVALEKMITRLQDDHDNARIFAEQLSKIAGLHVESSRVQTNMVYFDLDTALTFDASTLCQRTAQFRVKMLPTGKRRIRAVTHCYISRDDVIEAAQVIAHCVSNQWSKVRRL
jgi:threonine aldolase